MKDFSVIKIRIILYELHHFEEESGPFHIKQSIYRKIFYLFREEIFSASCLKRENSKEGGTRRKGVWARTFQPVQCIWNNFMVSRITKFHIFSITVFIWTFWQILIFWSGLYRGATDRNFWSGPVLNLSFFLSWSRSPGPTVMVRGSLVLITGYYCEICRIVKYSVWWLHLMCDPLYFKFLLCNSGYFTLDFSCLFKLKLIH